MADPTCLVVPAEELRQALMMLVALPLICVISYVVLDRFLDWDDYIRRHLRRRRMRLIRAGRE